ncbi:MAG: O-antigen ligase family protein [Cyanophyceae cyanobacterium]
MNRSIQPQNLPEAVVWYYLLGTYVVYYLGAQYVVTPLLGLFLVGYLSKQWWQAASSEPPITISSSAWVWVVAMVTVEVALIIGHLDFELGLVQIVKSSVNWWLRTWALFALFPLAGHLNIRPPLIYRAVCILCLQSLIVIGIGCLASLVNAPEIEFLSPLERFFRGTADHYHVKLFHGVINERLQLFTPWPTGIGMLGNIFFWFACREPEPKWRWLGLIGSLVMIFASMSRSAIVCLPFVAIVVFLLTKVLSPWLYFIAGFGTFLLSLILPTLMQFLEILKEQFQNFRGEDSAASSRVRDALERMALERWRNEAPIWGHGMLELRGPAVVAHMPIGSHHTWLGVLFTHGLVGGVALAIAFIWSFLHLWFKAQSSDLARVGLSIILVLLVSSFTDNIDSLAYVYWSPLLVLGSAFKESVSPQHLQRTNRFFINSQGY